MRVNTNIKILFALIFFCSSTHSFWGEQRIRFIFHWLYSCRISQFVLKKCGQQPRTPLEVILTMMQNKDNITHINNLEQKTQDLILKGGNLSLQEKNDRIKTITQLYQKNNFFSLVTVYGILEQFVEHQKQFLDQPWTVDDTNQTKKPVIETLFDDQNPSFYTERRILPEGGKTYLAADLHGDPSPVLDILQTLIRNGAFNGETGKLRNDTYLCFNGDFVDKGLNGSACLLLVYSLKILNPSQVIITRGNHEDPGFLQINKITDQRKLFDFGSELYCKYYGSWKNCLTTFLFPSKKLKQKLSESYATLPVMAFLLHKVDDQFHGYVASHAGLDPAYNPRDLLTQSMNQDVLFDIYDTKHKLSPRNIYCKKALIDELTHGEKVNQYVKTMQNYCLDQRKAREQDQETLQREDLESSNLEDFESYQQAMTQDISKLADLYQDIDKEFFKRYSATLLDPNSNQCSYKIFSIKQLDNGKKKFSPISHDFNPFNNVTAFENMKNYFEGPIESIKSVAACWHWKEPNKNNPSNLSVKPQGTHHEFAMSYYVFQALIQDYQTQNVKLTIATQGHIQTAGFGYNEHFGQNQKAIFDGVGYGDVWDESKPQFDTCKVDKRSLDEKKPYSHDIFGESRRFPNPSNPVIAASCGSLYGPRPTDEEFSKENKFQKEKCVTGQEHKDHELRFLEKYPGQWYNPVVALYYNENVKTICAQQSLVWHLPKGFSLPN